MIERVMLVKETVRVIPRL